MGTNVFEILFLTRSSLKIYPLITLDKSGNQLKTWNQIFFIELAQRKLNAGGDSFRKHK